ncbi:MAG TPA: hypothetical protein VFU36_12115 [Jatrophihabitans sp.]|nr:hypothetical protein [Jatrophihabitans sp.]
MSRPYFASTVHIEGMDLAGKSTVTGYLAGALGGRIQRNSLIPGNPIYSLADGLRRASAASPEVLGPLYVSAVCYDLDHLRRPDGPRVQDSTILLRSLAFNDLMGAKYVVRGLLEQLPRHPQFGRTIVLTATIEARQRRLAERRRVAPAEVAADDLMVETAPGLFLEMEKSLIKHAVQYFRAVVLDTSELSKDGVRSAVSSTLGRRA